jgi:hypothetical protein
MPNDKAKTDAEGAARLPQEPPSARQLIDYLAGVCREVTDAVVNDSGTFARQEDAQNGDGSSTTSPRDMHAVWRDQSGQLESVLEVPPSIADAELLTMWRSVQGPHAELTGPLIRFAGLVAAALLRAPEPPADDLRQRLRLLPTFYHSTMKLRMVPSIQLDREVRERLEAAGELWISQSMLLVELDRVASLAPPEGLRDFDVWRCEECGAIFKHDTEHSHLDGPRDLVRYRAAHVDPPTGEP